MGCDCGLCIYTGVCTMYIQTMHSCIDLYPLYTMCILTISTNIYYFFSWYKHCTVYFWCACCCLENAIIGTTSSKWRSANCGACIIHLRECDYWIAENLIMSTVMYDNNWFSEGCRIFIRHIQLFGPIVHACIYV